MDDGQWAKQELHTTTFVFSSMYFVPLSLPKIITTFLFFVRLISWKIGLELGRNIGLPFFALRSIGNGFVSIIIDRFKEKKNFSTFLKIFMFLFGSAGYKEFLITLSSS